MGGILSSASQALCSGRLDNVGAGATVWTLAMESRIDGQYIGAGYLVGRIQETVLHVHGGHPLNTDHLAGPNGGRHHGYHGSGFGPAHVLVDQGHAAQRQELGETVLGDEVPAPVERAVALADGIVELDAHRPVGADLGHAACAKLVLVLAYHLGCEF